MSKLNQELEAAMTPAQRAVDPVVLLRVRRSEAARAARRVGPFPPLSELLTRLGSITQD